MDVFSTKRYSVSFKDKRKSSLLKKDVLFVSKKSALSFARKLLKNKKVFEVCLNEFEINYQNFIRKYKTHEVRKMIEED